MPYAVKTHLCLRLVSSVITENGCEYVEPLVVVGLERLARTVRIGIDRYLDSEWPHLVRLWRFWGLCRYEATIINNIRAPAADRTAARRRLAAHRKEHSTYLARRMKGK